MRTLKRILEEKQITAFDVLDDNILMAAITDNGESINLDADTSNIVAGTPVIRKTDFTINNDILTIDDVDFNTLTIKELVDMQDVEDVEQITPAQGMVILSDMGLLEVVENMINNSNDDKMKIFWNRSVFWKKSSAIIQNMGNSLGINLDYFFYIASKVEI